MNIPKRFLIVLTVFSMFFGLLSATKITGKAEENGEDTITEETNRQEDDLESQKVKETGSVIVEELPEENEGEEELPEEAVEMKEEVSSMPAFEPAPVTIDGVVITVSAPEGVFPEGSVLSVNKVPADTKEKVDEAIETERDDNVNVVVSYTFDICVLNNGDEVQPIDGNKVKVSFALAEVADKNLDTNVYHVSENETTGALEAESLSVTQETYNEPVATVETDGFSYYTVEFTYEKKQYVMQGDTSVKLSDILTTVGLSGVVTSAVSNAPDLFSVSEVDGEYVVTAHKAFNTEQVLTVTINGTEYEIAVTDEVHAGDVAKIGDTGYATLELAITAANNMDNNPTITLLSNTTVNTGNAASSRLAISKSMTIDGQGYIVTINNRGFGVGMNAASPVDVTFKNIIIKNSSNGARCIDTRGNLNSLTLDKTTLDTTGSNSGYTQSLTIGGNQSSAATVTIKNNSLIQTNTEATAYYAIVTFNPVYMAIENSSIKGWACIYAKGKDGSAGSSGSTFNVSNSVLESKNIYSGTTNAFAMFTVEDENVLFNVENSFINVKATGDQNQAIATTKKEHVNVNLKTGNTITCDGEKAIICMNYANVSISGGVLNKVPDDSYIANGYSTVKLTDNTYNYGVLETPILTVSGGTEKTYDGIGVTLTATPSITSVTAGGNVYEVAYSYQWYKGDVEITGATSSTYTTGTNTTDSGTYKCTVTTGNTVLSDTATVKINAKQVENVDVVVADPDVEPVPDGWNEEKKNAANQIINHIQNAEVLNKETLVPSDSLSESLIKEIPADKKPGDNEKAVVQSYLTIAVKDVVVSGDEKKLVIEVTPMVRVVKMSKNEADETKGPDDPGVTLIHEPVINTELTNSTEPIQMEIPVPDGWFAEGTEVYINHTKGNGKSFIYKGSVSGNIASFINNHGFSTFTLSTSNPAVAEVVGDAGYTSLQDAVDNVSNGGTVNVLKPASVTTASVSKDISFTMTGGSSSLLKAGSGYTMMVSGNVYTFKKTSSGGSSSSTSSSSSKKTNSVVTCQMAGFPAGYNWNEAAKACQLGYVDDNGVWHSTAKKSAVPNTYDKGVIGSASSLVIATLFAIGSVLILKKY